MTIQNTPIDLLQHPDGPSIVLDDSHLICTDEEENTVRIPIGRLTPLELAAKLIQHIAALEYARIEGDCQ